MIFENAKNKYRNSPPIPLSASQRGGVRSCLTGTFPLFAKQRGGKEGGEFRRCYWGVGGKKRGLK
jgi:hypothetical protein